MKVTINASDNVAVALRHSLVHTLGLTAGAIVVSETEPTGAVAADGKTYCGLMAILRVMRAAETDAAKRVFLSGETGAQTVLINQWVSIAASLSNEAKKGGGAVTPTLVDVERILETHHLFRKFLADTRSPTIADAIFYGALHGGRTEEDTKALPAHVAEWSRHAQADAAIAPFKSAFLAKASSGTKEAAEPSAFVKPSDEEIQRRREEKERLKKEKDAAKTAAAAAGCGAAASADVGSIKRKAEKGPKPLTESTKNPPKKELDASSLDVRVGQFTNVRKHPTADRLYVEDMDLGDETRTIVSGLVDHFNDPKMLEGRQILVMCNMKPKALLGVTSHGMILCASNEDGLALVSPPEGAKPGDRIVFGDRYSEPGPAAEVLSSNKMSDLLSSLRTDNEGVLCWKDAQAYHANGIVSCPAKKNCLVK